MYARKIAQISETRRYTRRHIGSLTCRRPRKASGESSLARDRSLRKHRQLFLVFLFAVCQFVFLQSTIFDVKDISIESSGRISKDAIRKVLDLGASPSYWSLIPADIQANLLELQGVESAQVDLIFPGRLSVRVAERKPLYNISWAAATNKNFTVDREGIILADHSALPNALSVVLQRPVRVGGILSPSELKTLEFFQKHLESPLAGNLKSIEFSNSGEVTLRLVYNKSKIPVRLGKPEQLSYKLFVLGELMKSLQAEHAVVLSIDLRFTTPIVRTPVAVQPSSV